MPGGGRSMATGPIETHLHRSFNWENAAPGARMGPRGRSASCGNGPFAQCVRLRSEINLKDNKVVFNYDASYLSGHPSSLYVRVNFEFELKDKDVDDGEKVELKFPGVGETVPIEIQDAQLMETNQVSFPKIAVPEMPR